MFELDFGSNKEVTAISLDKSGKILASKNDTIALVDADTVIFAACSANEYSYEEEDADGNFITKYTIDLEVAYKHAIAKLQTILDYTGCKDWELHFTIGRKSFRYLRVDCNYKANRLEDNEGKRVPSGLYDLKMLFTTRHSDKAFAWIDCEADDAVVYLKTNNYDKYTLCALDKDVLYSIQGSHFNYYSSTKYNIDMKFYTVDKGTALKHHYKQTLTGDTSDGIIGLKGIGPKTADKILNNLVHEADMWDAVIREYTIRNRSEIDAIMNMRLVNMHQVTKLLDNGKVDIQLWKPIKNKEI